MKIKTALIAGLLSVVMPLLYMASPSPLRKPSQEKLSPSVIPCKVTQLMDGEWANIPQESLYIADDRTLWIDNNTVTSPTLTDRKIFKHEGQIDLYVEKKLFDTKWPLVEKGWLHHESHIPIYKIILVEDIKKVELDENAVQFNEIPKLNK